MQFPPTAEQRKVLNADDDIVVIGQPGSGKTSIALEKSRLFLEKHASDLAPDQRVLFLSFSNPAVQRIRSAAQVDLPRDVRRRLVITTFHSFCYDFLRSYGCFAGLRAPFQLLSPEDEKLRTFYTPSDAERLAKLRSIEVQEGRVRFDRFAELTASILEQVRALRRSYACAYPLILADEYQDTSDDQHKLIQQLRSPGQLICLGDEEQRIYDWDSITGSRPDRLQRLVSEEALRPILLPHNHRSSSAPEIYAVAHAVLKAVPRVRKSSAVKVYKYGDNKQLENVLKREILSLENAIRAARGQGRVTLAVMTYTNTFIASLSQMLRRVSDGNGYSYPFYHQLLIRPEDLGIAWRAIMECLTCSDPDARASALLLGAAGLHRTNSSKSVFTDAENLEKWAEQLNRGTFNGRTKSVQILRGKLAVIGRWTGDPTADVEQVCRALDAASCRHLAPLVRALEIRPPHDSSSDLAQRLNTSFSRDRDYRNAPKDAEASLLVERLEVASGIGPARTLMTLHKCKGKEFDGVIIVDGRSHESVLIPKDKPPQFPRSRRLLHVGLTRARYGARLLTPYGDECPIWPKALD